MSSKIRVGMSDHWAYVRGTRMPLRAIRPRNDEYFAAFGPMAWKFSLKSTTNFTPSGKSSPFVGPLPRFRVIWISEFSID